MPMNTKVEMTNGIKQATAVVRGPNNTVRTVKAGDLVAFKLDGTYGGGKIDEIVKERWTGNVSFRFDNSDNSGGVINAPVNRCWVEN